MSDISKCHGINCDVKNTCLRYVIPADPLMQSYIAPDENPCTYRIPTKEHTEHKILEIRNASNENIYLFGDESNGLLLAPFCNFTYCKTCNTQELKVKTNSGKANIQTFEFTIPDCRTLMENNYSFIGEESKGYLSTEELLEEAAQDLLCSDDKEGHILAKKIMVYLKK